MNIPALGGNWVDLAILFILFYYLLAYSHRGFLLGTLDLFGFIFSFVAALKLYSLVGQFLIANFSLSRGIANASGFFIAGILSEFIYTSLFNYIVDKFYSKTSKLFRIKGKLNLLFSIDNFFGFIPAFGEAVIFTAFILTLLVTLPIQGRIKNAIVSSKIGAPLINHTQGIERQINTIFGEAVNETLTFLTVNPNPASRESINLGFTQGKGVVDETAERSMLTLVNLERQKYDLPLLQLSIPLRDVARLHAQDMFKKGYFSHYNPAGQSPFDRMRASAISFLAAGENLALAPNVALAHQGLMNSPGHRANILSADFGQIGIGAIDGGIFGLLFVQEFTN